jgi:hypothetical protein
MYALLRRHQPRPCARRLLTTPAALSCPPRTHTCGALGPADAGKRVVLAGWLLPERCAHTRCMHDATGGDMAACAGRCRSGCRSSRCATHRGRRSSRSTPRPTARSRRCLRARSSPPCSSRARSGCGPMASAAPCVPPSSSPLPRCSSPRQEAAGSIEVLVDAATLLNAAAQPLPFYASDASVLVSCLPPACSPRRAALTDARHSRAKTSAQGTGTSTCAGPRLPRICVGAVMSRSSSGPSCTRRVCAPPACSISPS